MVIQKYFQGKPFEKKVVKQNGEIICEDGTGYIAYDNEMNITVISFCIMGFIDGKNTSIFSTRYVPLDDKWVYFHSTFNELLSSI
jgi:hypothetical protein